MPFGEGSGLRVGVPRERSAGERRVALVPESVGKLAGEGHAVTVESGLGEGAGLTDEAYRERGAVVAEDASEVFAADLVVCVRPPGPERRASLRAGGGLAGLLRPLSDPEGAAALAGTGVTAFSLDLMPRITRAQGMDVLSAMSTVAGYRAALDGAVLSGRFFPMLMTAAGTVTPAHVLVLGAGVAGLQAIATARRLGAVVQAFDLRPAVQEQVESLGATFLTLPEGSADAEAQGGYARRVAADEEAAEQALLAEPVARADVVITTALVPGAPAPRLVTEAMVAAMHPGAVVIDLAAEAGGNCAATVPGERVERFGVIVDGPLSLAGEMPLPASQLYSRALTAFILHLAGTGFAAGAPNADLTDDPIARATCLARGGELVHADTRERLAAVKGDA